MNHPNAQVIEQAQAVWGLALQPAGCPACQRAFLAEAARLGQPCPACARADLTPQPAWMRPEPPEQILAFARRLSPGGAADLRPALEAFLKPVWLKPTDLTADNLLRRAAPVFWPRWLVDAQLAGHWQAELGFDYQVQSSQENYQAGQWSTTTVQETRIRWEPRCGALQRAYPNAPAPALTDEAALTARVGDYHAEAAQPYTAEGVRGALVRVPDLPPEAAWAAARAALETRAAADCQAAAGAQHVRQIALSLEFTGQHWTQQLLPLYATYYADDDGQRQTIFINGQTGRVGGRRLASPRLGRQWALGLAAGALGLFLLGGVLLLAGALFPPLWIIGGLLAVGALALGAAALAPALWPAHWNRQQGP